MKTKTILIVFAIFTVVISANAQPVKQHGKLSVNKTYLVADKNETCSMLYPSAGDTGNWSDPDLKESGLKTRELLKKYNK